MAPPHRLVPAFVVTASALAVAAPSAQAAASSYGKAYGDALSSTVKKQLDPKAGVLTNLTTTLKSIVTLTGPAKEAPCEKQATSKPFAQWNDNADYVPVPNSGFEQGLDTWSPLGVVTLADDNHDFGISGHDDDHTSVVLRDGSSVASASFCGGLEYPTIRMMARAANGKRAKGVVTVRYTGKDGIIGALPLGSIEAGPDWAPSSITLTASGIPLFTGTRLGVTITSVEGTLALDDVYVDPFRRA